MQRNAQKSIGNCAKNRSFYDNEFWFRLHNGIEWYIKNERKSNDKKNSSQKYRQLLSYKKKLSHSICLKLSYFIAFAIEEFAHKYGFSIAQLNAFLPFDTFILFHPFFFRFSLDVGLLVLVESNLVC